MPLKGSVGQAGVRGEDGNVKRVETNCSNLQSVTAMEREDG
jgi:hypothetical protein